MATAARPVDRASQALCGVEDPPLDLAGPGAGRGCARVGGRARIAAHDLGADPADAAHPRCDARAGVRAPADADAIDAADGGALAGLLIPAVGFRWTIAAVVAGSV